MVNTMINNGQMITHRCCEMRQWSHQAVQLSGGWRSSVFASAATATNAVITGVNYNFILQALLVPWFSASQRNHHLQLTAI